MTRLRIVRVKILKNSLGIVRTSSGVGGVKIISIIAETDLERRVLKLNLYIFYLSIYLSSIYL
jgi:hypothetical protein